ncbi:hypothetical protein Q5752_005976 [Cryptotrichosporon argae]
MGDASWMVDDLGDTDELDLLSSDDVPEPPEPIEYGLGGRPAAYPSIDTWLANVILLIGPNGVGKSAAVYAAAHELGWEVFEVYPGVGKRTGVGLSMLVGDVGKNHMVGQDKDKEKGQRQAKAKPALASFFGTEERLSSQGSAADPIEIDGPALPALQAKSAQLFQSLILIDEVDTLFDEESTFWPAVVTLAAESRRPIVLTCNDTTRVPRAALAQLPLQTILHFLPPQRHVTEAYLAAIAAHEGIPTTGQYDAGVSPRVDLLDQPLPPNGNEPMPHFDLRRAIMQMQLDRKSGPQAADVDDGVISGQDLAQLARCLDLRSYADAWVAPRSWAVMDVAEVDRFAPGPDDEGTTHPTTLLVKPEVARPTLPAYDRASEYAAALGCTGSVSNSILARRINYIRSILPLLDPLIPLSAPLLPHASLFLDVLPAVTYMVAADDVLEAAERAAIAAGERLTNRKTGRPMRIASWMGREAYVRWLDVSDAGLLAARNLRRVWDAGNEQGENTPGTGEHGPAEADEHMLA